MKDPLGVSLSKGNQGTTRGKEKFLLTSVGIEPTTSGLDLPLLCRLSYERFQKHRFEIAPPWRAFSNSSVFGDRFRRCSVDDSRIRNKTAPFSFENGLMWTGP